MSDWRATMGPSSGRRCSRQWSSAETQVLGYDKTTAPPKSGERNKEEGIAGTWPERMIIRAVVQAITLRCDDSANKHQYPGAAR